MKAPKILWSYYRSISDRSRRVAIAQALTAAFQPKLVQANSSHSLEYPGELDWCSRRFICFLCHLDGVGHELDFGLNRWWDIRERSFRAHYKEEVWKVWDGHSQVAGRTEIIPTILECYVVPAFDCYLGVIAFQSRVSLLGPTHTIDRMFRKDTLPLSSTTIRQMTVL